VTISIEFGSDGFDERIAKFLLKLIFLNRFLLVLILLFGDQVKQLGQHGVIPIEVLFFFLLWTECSELFKDTRLLTL